jgi:hypothetical protein
MNDLLVTAACVACTAPLWGSVWLWDRLLRIESKAHEGQHARRAVGFLSLAFEMGRRPIGWADIRALILGLQLYTVWLFRMPLWARGDLRARRALWAMRSLFWLCVLGMYVVRETLL